MRKPWNTDVTGLLSVNNLEDFLQLIHQIRSTIIRISQPLHKPSVLALVGPSGSGKAEWMNALIKETGWRAFSNPRYFPEPYRRQKGWERIRNDNESDNSMDGFQEIPTEEMEQLGFLIRNSQFDLYYLYSNTIVIFLLISYMFFIILTVYVLIKKVFIKDISTKIDEKNNQILVSYSEPYDYTNLENSELVHYRYFHRRCAIVVPYQNELGYTIESVEDGQFFADEKLKEIANNLQVPDSLNVNYKQEAKANYWEEADKYLVKVEVLSDDQVVASALVDHQTGELCKNILNYKDSKEESIALNIYQPLIDAYRQYYFNGVETEGILTENIIFQEMYGVSNPYQWVAQFRFEAIQQPLYYGLIDLNSDGYEECIFTSNDLSDPEYVQVYDIWTRDDTSFYHLFSGGPHQHNAWSLY